MVWDIELSFLWNLAINFREPRRVSLIGCLSPTLVKIVANWIFILRLGSVPDGVDKLKVLIEAMFCFEPIRDETMSSLLVKFERWTLDVSELSFWLQVVDVWLLVTWGRGRDADGLLMHKLHVCELLMYFVLEWCWIWPAIHWASSYMNESMSTFYAH